MSTKPDALHAITMQGDRIVRVVQAPHVLGWTEEEYQIWAWKLTYAWAEMFQKNQKLVIFCAGSDLDENRKHLEEDGMKNLDAFDQIEQVDFDDFNNIIGGKSL